MAAARRQATTGLRGLLGRLGRALGFGRVAARYDAAQTTDGNRKHWGNADSLSADSANSPSVRLALRNRARYEVANNSFLYGIVSTLANDTVGTGPRLQLLDKAKASDVERSWESWARKVGLARKLRTMSRAWSVDGEAFAIKIDNPNLDHVVKLDLRLVEAEQVASPLSAFSLTGPNSALLDGITLDAYGNPLSYSVAREHPGSSGFSVFASDDYETVKAADMIHLFSADRPGQHRGIPRIMSSLTIGSILRRFREATLRAAETAAQIAMVTYTDSPPDGEAVATNPMETVDLESNVATTLPAGWKLGQVKAEHPNLMFEEFNRNMVSDMGRPVNMPYNIAACDSSRYNYASGRLDHKTYFKSIDVDRSDFETVVLDAIFAAWIWMYMLATRQFLAVDHEWYWPGDEHVDPVKEATAQQIRIDSGVTTLKRECAAQGEDWEQVIEQRGIEREKLAARNLLPVTPAVPKPAPGATPPIDPDEEIPEEAVH